MSMESPGPRQPAPMIPGAYEPNPPTARQPGTMGGPAFGSMNEPMAHGLLDAATIADREREGGGAPSERHRKVPVQAQSGTAPGHTEDKRSWFTVGFPWFRILRFARR